MKLCFNDDDHGDNGNDEDDNSDKDYSGGMCLKMPWYAKTCPERIKAYHLIVA